MYEISSGRPTLIVLPTWHDLSRPESTWAEPELESEVGEVDSRSTRLSTWVDSWVESRQHYTVAT